MPKIERPPFTVAKVVVHQGTPHQSTMWKLEGRKDVFGRRVRKFFETAKAARDQGNKMLAETRQHGQNASTFTEAQRADAGQAMCLLGEKATLMEAVEFYLANRPLDTDMSVRDAAGEFLESRGIPREELSRKAFKRRLKSETSKTKQSYRGSHQSTLLCRLKPFVKKFGVGSMREISTQKAAIRQWLEKQDSNLVSLDNRRRSIHSFFAWAMEKEYCSDNPAVRWSQLGERIRQSSKRRPDIIAPDELDTLLRGALKSCPQILGCLALAAFTGIRTEELNKLKWNSVKLADGFVLIPEDISKTGVERQVSLHAPVQAWLKRCTRQGRIVAVDMVKRRRTLCDGLGIKWKRNWLRHSFGSYRYADTKDLSATAYEMSHEDIATFRRYYLNRGITAADCKKYWAISPVRKP